VIDALIPKGVCWHCDEAQADQNFWICKGCWVSVRRVAPQASLPQTTILYRYEGALETLLTRAKQPLEPAIYSLLLDTDFSMPRDAVYIPVPTPWHRRIRRRGCQTTCIAELLVRRFGGRVVHGLKRSRHHRRQASLSGEGRRQLPLDAFARSRSFVESERLVLVDDVMTTGTTLQRAEAVLDAERVHRFVVGRVF
jgi:predicted amidophosphoribosyltransferase